MAAIDPVVYPKKVQDDGSWIQPVYNRMQPHGANLLPMIYGSQRHTDRNKITVYPAGAQFDRGNHEYTAPQATSEGKVRAGHDERFRFPISRGRK